MARGASIRGVTREKGSTDRHDIAAGAARFNAMPARRELFQHLETTLKNSMCMDGTLPINETNR